MDDIIDDSLTSAHQVEQYVPTMALLLIHLSIHRLDLMSQPLEPKSTIYVLIDLHMLNVLL